MRDPGQPLGSLAGDPTDEPISATRPTVPAHAEPTWTSDPASSDPAPSFATPAASERGLASQHRDPDRYNILGEHGRGGLGRVSRAHDRELSRDIAIKELISRSALSEVRFLREALITARLEHPGIVPVHEAGRWPDGTPFYAMKLVSGRPLCDLIAERTTVDERVGLLHHVIAVADAIAYAHGRSIIHRDLKPSNVIVGDFGETVVIDWGLAKDLTAAEEPAIGGGPFREPHDEGLTSAGTVLGTPAYMPPEQARGEPVDQRADVFAIGVMLWELCTLQKLPPGFSGQRRQILRKSGIDPDLITIAEKALDPDPERRYPDAGVLAADLKAFKSGVRIAARRYSILAMLAHWTRRHRLLAGATAAVLALSVAGGVLYVRSVLAERVAEQVAIQAQVEQGRLLLLVGGTARAAGYLLEAYRRGDHSWPTAFMLARSMEPQRAELARLPALRGRMWSVTESPDGQQIATTDEGGAQIWDAHTYRRLHVLQHADVVYDAAFTTDGTLITACGDGAVRIWSATSGKLVRELRTDSRTRYVKLATHGEWIAALDYDGAKATVWSSKTGRVVAALNDNGGTLWSLEFSASGRWLATNVGDQAHVLSTETWQELVPITGAARSLAWDPTEDRFAVGAPSGDISIWGIDGRRGVHLREIGSPVDMVVFSADGKQIGTADLDGTIRIWDAASGRQRSQIARAARVRSIMFDATSDRIAAGGSDGSVGVFETATGLSLARLDGAKEAVWSLRFDAQRIVAASWSGAAHVWDARSQHRSWMADATAEACGVLTSTAVDRRFVAIGCEGHATRVWDTAAGALLASLPPMSKPDGDWTPVLPVVSEDGSRAMIARSNTAELYELPGGRLLRTVVHAAPVSAVAFGRGRDLVTGAVDGTLQLTHDGEQPIALPAAPDGIDAVGALQDGRVIATDAGKHLRVISSGGVDVLETPTRITLLRPSPDGRLVTLPGATIPSLGGRADPAVLWDLHERGGRLIAELRGNLGRVMTARWTDRGVVTVGADGTARLWDASTGRLVREYEVLTQQLLVDVALSPDGKLLAAGGADGLVEFWDVATGRELWALRTHVSQVVGVHFEGADLVTHGFGGEIARWHFASAAGVVSGDL